MNSEYTEGMLRDLRAAIGKSVTLTYLAGGTVTGTLTANPASRSGVVAPYLVGSNGTVIVPNWPGVAAVTYTAS